VRPTHVEPRRDSIVRVAEGRTSPHITSFCVRSIIIFILDAALSNGRYSLSHLKARDPRSGYTRKSASVELPQLIEHRTNTSTRYDAHTQPRNPYQDQMHAIPHDRGRFSVLGRSFALVQVRAPLREAAFLPVRARAQFLCGSPRRGARRTPSTLPLSRCTRAKSSPKSCTSFFP